MLIAGVDEAGRGPLAGPVVAAAVILDPGSLSDYLDDSKKLSEKRREFAFERLRNTALAIGIGQASREEIDEINILQASMLAMSRAVAALEHRPDKVLVDGNLCPKVAMPAQAVVNGDSLVACISAASIIAKVTRDRMMFDLHERYPEYGFDRHKGYPTAAHKQALRRLGPIDAHRRSFRPVAECLL